MFSIIWVTITSGIGYYIGSLFAHELIGLGIGFCVGLMCLGSSGQSLSNSIDSAVDFCDFD